MHKDEWEQLEGRQKPESVYHRGVELRAGHRVRLWPTRSADIMDLALRGREAMVHSLEQDYEGALYVAVVVDDDPGRDLGMARQPGHLFFFALDEVEPLEAS